ncbi:hypothetical protein LXL04_023132 [Taraxacum kok-saghyz]
MSTTALSSVADKETLCHCNLLPRTCTSKTKENPKKKYQVCPNSLMSMKLSSDLLKIKKKCLTFVSILKPCKKCHYWEWVEEGSAIVKVNLEDEIAAVKKKSWL